MKSKKTILTIILLVILVACAALMIFSGRKNNIMNKDAKNIKNEQKLKVTASNFASYDFLRAIIGDSKNIELTFLLGPGKDAHSYDPTPQDLIKIQNSDLFVYIGGEMEKWANRVMETLDTKKTNVLCIADKVDTIKEQEIEGAEDDDDHDHEEEHEHDEKHEDHDHEKEENDHDEHEKEHEHHHDHDEEGAFDEHIWTSPENAIKMVKALEKEMEKIDSANAEKYRKNAEKYIKEIQEVDKEIRNIVDNKKRDRLVFGDKMPMQYFINYYGLKVSAAFMGCSTETEPSAQTIAYLVNKVKEEKIPVILYIELGNGKVADTVAKEAGNCKIMQIQTLHNVSKDDFEKGKTWVSLMKENINVLKEALD